MKYVETILLLVFCTVICFGQTKKVTGFVKDASDGSGMPGVLVVKKGVVGGTATNVNGEFSIDAAENDILVFSFIGKKTVEVKPGNRQIVEIVLYDDETLLEEVVVTAFGKAKKSSVVSSIETVKMSDLKISASNLTGALAGKIPGVISYQTSGEPGADNAQFFIRGVTTFGYKSSPLILIDGFESTTDDLARLQPDDIESFSVMKDAAATVMYGARSANGIVSVVTKGGREGPVRVSVRMDMHVATPTQNVKYLDGLDYMRMYNEARLTRNPDLGTFYSEQKIISTGLGENPMIYPNVNWYDALFNKTTTNEKANVNISGGGQVATYFVSGGFDHETGLLKVEKRNNFNNNINIKRFNIRSNVIFKLTPTTTLDTRIQGRFERYNGPYRTTTDIYRMVMNSNPVDFPFVYEPDAANEFTEHVLFGSTFTTNQTTKANPYAELVRGYEDRNETSITAMATLTQDLGFLTEGLKINLKVSANTWSKYTSKRTYIPFLYALESYNLITEQYKLLRLNPAGTTGGGQAYLGDVEPGRDASGQYYYEGIINWARKFGKHSPGVTIVGIAQENLLTGGNSRSVFVTLPEKNLGVSGRFTYDFDSRYYADFSFGYNGSEKFTGDKKYGFFPAIGCGWIISNESFWETWKDRISNLKLKATWGKGGNDAIAGREGRFFFLSDITTGGGAYRWGSTFTNYYDGYTVRRYANPDITWEISTKYNLGLELGLLKNEAVKIQADFFKEKREDIYMVRQNFPFTAGLEATISGNVGEVDAQGFDASIDVQHYFSNDFWITGRGNFTYATNKYVELDEKNYPDTYLKQKGHPVTQEWGLIAERLFVDELEIENSPKQDFGEYHAGDIKYKDVNGDGVVNKNDMVPMGYPTIEKAVAGGESIKGSPQMQYGFGLSTGYKAFDFSFFFQGNARVSFFINPGTGEGIAPFVDYRNALTLIAEDYWSETNPDVHAFWPRLSTNPISNNTQPSSWWLRDASFLRLKTVELGYNVPGIEKMGLQTGRIYLSSENLFVISAFKLWDPEMGSNGLAYPPNKRFNIGIQLSF
jgi:TonB-linked SusC/RagA family outer membrane protein